MTDEQSRDRVQINQEGEQKNSEFSLHRDAKYKYFLALLPDFVSFSDNLFLVAPPFVPGRLYLLFLTLEQHAGYFSVERVRMCCC